MDINPWQVESIQDFSFLKCPECTFDTKDEDTFQDHATESHPLSFVFFVERLNEVNKNNKKFKKKIKKNRRKFDENKVKEEPISDSSDIEENGDGENLTRICNFCRYIIQKFL